MNKPKSAPKSTVSPDSGSHPVNPSAFRSMESLLAGLTRGRRSSRRGLEAAQECIYNAWEADDPQERIAIAREALELSPDCADAYSLLAVEAVQTDEERIGIYRLAVAAGERALGKQAFREDIGYFWGLLETRPYMRARCSLAQVLWRSGMHEEAVDHYWDLLRLNPGDNQGVRDLLMPCLIALGRDRDAERLYKQYRDDAMATWLYSRALLDYRRERDVPKAVSALKNAVEYNPHVPAYLLGHRKMPRRLPSFIGIGDVNEAVSYVYGNREAWAATGGALHWLNANRGKRPRLS